jgi:hypothetical protein
MPNYNGKVLRVSGSADLVVEAPSQGAALAAALEVPITFEAPAHRCVAVLPHHIENGTGLDAEDKRSSS